MDSKENTNSTKSTLLMVNEDLDKIEEFDEKNYPNRKYNADNFDQGKKFFELRYIKSKLDLFLKNKSPQIKKETKLLPELDQSEKEKLILYEELSLNHKKTKQNNIQKYSSMFIILLEKSIFYFNSEKTKESYEVLYDYDVIKSEAEFGEILLIISGYDRNLIEENIFKKKEKEEIIKGFLNCIQMSHYSDLFECYKFINSRVILPPDDANKGMIINTITDRYYEDNKDNEKIMNIYKTRVNIFIYIKALFTRNMLKYQNIKMTLNDLVDCIPFIEEKELKILYEKLNHNFQLDTNYLSELYEKFLILLEEKEINYDNKDIKELTNTSEKINYMNYLTEKEIINREMSNKNLSLIKLDFNVMSNLSFGKKEQETLTVPIEFNRISGSSLTLKEYLLIENFTKIIFEKKLNTAKLKAKHGNSINIDDIIDIRLGSSGTENFKKYFKSFPNEEKNQNNFISIICTKEQFDLKSTDTEKGLKWFKALKSLIVFKAQNKEKKNENEKKIKEDISIIWKNYILPKWNIYGNYFLFKTLDRANYLKDINFNPEGKKQNPTIKYDILEDKKTPLIKSINSFLKEVKDKLGKKDDKILEFNEFMVLCELGIADITRKKIWPILIGNKCGIMNLKENVTKIDNFDELEKEYLKNVNINFIEIPSINTMIKDIIKIKYYFLNEIESKKITQNDLMSKVYTISRAFFLYSFDIPYNKNIIFLIYTFLLKEIPEEQTFISICNLICSNNTLANLYLWKKKYIKIHEIFNEKFEKYLPKLFNHLDKLGISSNLYLFDWIESLFTKILNIKVASIVIDLYLIFGEHVLIQASITILKLIEDDLINMNAEEILKELNNSLLDRIGIYQFFECYKNLGGIRNDYIEYRINNEFGFQKTDLLEILMNN